MSGLIVPLRGGGGKLHVPGGKNRGLTNLCVLGPQRSKVSSSEGESLLGSPLRLPSKYLSNFSWITLRAILFLGITSRFRMITDRVKILVDVSDIYIFSARGRGRGSPRRQEGAGSVFFLKIPGGSAGNFGGGGLNIFLGAEIPNKNCFEIN